MFCLYHNLKIVRTLLYNYPSATQSICRFLLISENDLMIRLLS